MSVFDELDARIAAAVGRTLNERVTWRPQVKPTGGVYTQKPPAPDPARPVRELAGVVTWNLGNTPLVSGQGQAGGAQIGTASLLVDFETALFEGAHATHGYPRRGDRFDLPDEKDPANRVVEVVSQSDDGSSRTLCWCTVVRQ